MICIEVSYSERIVIRVVEEWIDIEGMARRARGCRRDVHIKDFQGSIINGDRDGLDFYGFV